MPDDEETPILWGSPQETGAAFDFRSESNPPFPLNPPFYASPCKTLIFVFILFPITRMFISLDRAQARERERERNTTNLP
ncbi:beta-eliminating lyase [Colletotrichum cuscutae]|uniref:Beta-eliminating lyase n=1 Tax=Colletotrichum cuscutae TaxID=1209917 RepID=A0AAI9Y168_9PEZI|nr:beta-eliminating lyase [Colletotrichum cuscutae]